MRKLTLKDLDASQLQQVNVKLAQAKKSLQRPLTNAEKNKIKDEILIQFTKEQEKLAKQARALKKQQKYVPGDNTFDWSKKNHSRGFR